MEAKEKTQQLQTIKEKLQQYHGATKLQNIPEITSSALYQNLFTTITISLDQTVSEVLKKINDALNTDSIIFQFGRFQEQLKKKAILPSQKMPENQRIAFYTGKDLHEWLEMIFSPQQYYFTVNRAKFKKGDKKYNRGVYQNAIDTVIIDPEKVADSSLETLGIQLDPDCQNLKDIFKKMRPLNYQDAEAKKYTIRIHEYEGKYIVFTANKIVYDATLPATKGEQKKEDIKGFMGVYPDIFSIIRRENYIIDESQEKQSDYQDIKKKLLASIKEIVWNKKEYSLHVQQNVQEIIAEIDTATSAKIMADKLYHLYKITGKHSERDKLLLEASMKNFTQRIAQLIGISSHIHLHLLELTDILEDQALDIQSFHAQVAISIHKPIQHQQEDMFSLACETYYNSLKRYKTLKEPFLTFAKQIQQLCGADISKVKYNIKNSLPKIQEITLLQEKVLAGYLLEHQLNLEEKTIEEVAYKLENIQSGFSVDMTKKQRDEFFDELKNLNVLQRHIDEITNRV